ncbi:MAG: alpha/beta fold hydrolase, partial [Alphaproteobacteria bacterium]
MFVRLIFGLGSVVLVIAAGLAAALIFGTAPPPPPLRSISAAGEQIARAAADLPRLETFQARDKTALAYRRYAGNPGHGLAVLIHGSSGSSAEMHLAAKALARSGIGAVAIDVRGHGASGRRGDISYAGQLDDDMTDLVRYLAKQYPGEPRILIGHSSGGGYVLHVAASRLACAFKGYIALSPYLNYRAPTVRPGNGGWTGVY